MNKNIAAKFERLIEEIKNKKVLPGVPADHMKFIEDVYKEAKEFAEDSEGVYKEYVDLNGYAMWHYKEEKPDFKCDDFIFPRWSPEETYKRQLEALEFAFSCTEIYDKMELAVNALDKALSNDGDSFMRKRYTAFRAEIIYEEAVGDEYKPVKGKSSKRTENAPSEYVLLELLGYEEAKQKVKELNEQGKNAVLIMSPDKILTRQKVQEINEHLDYVGRMEFNKKCASYGVDLINVLNGNRGISEYENLLEKQKDSYEFWYDFWGENCGHAILSLLFPPYFIVRLIVCLIKRGVTGGHIRTGKLFKNAVIEAYNDMLRKNLSEIKEKLPYDKLDEIYDFIYRAEIPAKERMPEMRKILKKNKAACDAATDFLPANLERKLLPVIIDLLKSGTASDYKTAIWQAKQVSEQRQANEAMQLSQKIEAERQRKQQEYYQNRQLLLARQQAESQKRTEEYAKQQAEAAKVAAESAKQQAEAAKAAAKAEEKQAETVEEILRQSNDPYYIKLRKGSN